MSVEVTKASILTTDTYWGLLKSGTYYKLNTDGQYDDKPTVFCLTSSDLKDWLLRSDFETFNKEKYQPLALRVNQLITGLGNCALKTEVASVENSLEALKKQIIEIISLSQQQGSFIQQFGAMVEAVDSLMKQQEELASLGEAQYAQIKQRAEAVSALYEKMLELNEKLTATCLTEIENFRKKSEELQAVQQQESKRCIDDFLANKKQEFLAETSRSIADIVTAEKNSFNSNIQQTTQQNIQKMKTDVDAYFNKKQEEFNSQYNSFGKRLKWLFTGK